MRPFPDAHAGNHPHIFGGQRARPVLRRDRLGMRGPQPAPGFEEGIVAPIPGGQGQRRGVIPALDPPHPDRWDVRQGIGRTRMESRRGGPAQRVREESQPDQRA